jgi:XTP/dITP diphosphohydrolase
MPRNREAPPPQAPAPCGAAGRDGERLRLAVATSNPGKLAELSLLLAPLDCEVLSTSRETLAWAGLADARDPVEDGETFFQNAYIKARYWADLLGMPCLADDSGLVVRALGGEPGVRSARWGGWKPGAATGMDQSLYLLGRMEGLADREAAFLTSLVLARPFRREALHYEGVLAGEVADGLRGDQGFGYDQAFMVPELGRTLAELSPAVKNAVSHRGRAFRAMREDWARVRGFLAE